MVGVESQAEGSWVRGAEPLLDSGLFCPCLTLTSAPMKKPFQRLLEGTIPGAKVEKKQNPATDQLFLATCPGEADATDGVAEYCDSRGGGSGTSAAQLP